MKRLALTIILAVLPLRALACEGTVAVCDGVSAGSFALIKDGRPATVYVGVEASKPVQRVAVDFATDLGAGVRRPAGRGTRSQGRYRRCGGDRRDRSFACDRG